MKEKHNKINILEIKGNSLDDGPGIRTVVFFKGCPLSCVWCHNPESKTLNSQIAFDAKECIACDICLSHCSQNALSRKNPFYIDREKCTLCYDCVENCPSGALSRVGKTMDMNDILLEIEKDLPFFKTSKGGVTFSGGEPTLNSDLLKDLLIACKSKNIHTLLETCGYFNWDYFQDNILPYIDMIYYDIKIMDAKAHQTFCGKDNQLILSNFEKLCGSIQNTNIHLIPRTPLIPNITATIENIRAIAYFLNQHHISQAQLLEYNPLWLEKNNKIGISNPYANNSEMTKWMTQQSVNQLQEIFQIAGIEKYDT